MTWLWFLCLATGISPAMMKLMYKGKRACTNIGFSLYSQILLAHIAKEKLLQTSSMMSSVFILHNLYLDLTNNFTIPVHNTQQ